MHPAIEAAGRQANPAAPPPGLPRRGFLVRSTAAGAALLAVGALPRAAGAASAPAPAAAGLHFTAPIPAILAAMRRHPLVGLGDPHQNQEFHDFLTALLFHPELPGRITAIVVEFGNALYQEVADRFILEDRPVANAELQPIWRNTVGGFPVTWDAPVYEQFFRIVRALNWTLPPSRRIRVLLGDPPVDFGKLRSAADLGYFQALTAQRDAHYAGVVEREVLAKGGRALLIAGTGHLRRGLHADHFPKLPNAATLLVRKRPGALFTIDPLLSPPGASHNPEARPALALLAGTRLGAQRQPERAITPDAAVYSAQADAVLYLGPGELLTASRADPAIYEAGAYRDRLRRLSALATAATGQTVDYVAEGLRLAQLPPSFFAQPDTWSATQ